MNKLDRLEQALVFWERQAYTGNVLMRTGVGVGAAINGSPCGPKAYSHQFRQHLLHARSAEFDGSRFISSMNESYMGSHYRVPEALFAWSRHSRKLFQLTGDLQMVLANTSLKNVKWQDITWPFPAFAIGLEVPLVGDEGSYDCMIVAADAEGVPGLAGKLRVYLFDTRLEKAKPIEPIVKARVEKAIRLKEKGKVGKVLLADAGSHLAVTGCFITVSQQDFDQKVGQSAVDLINTRWKTKGQETIREENFTEFDRSLRLAAGLALYLQTLPSGSPHQSEWKDRLKSGLSDPRAITKEAQVCEVSQEHVLTAEEREVYQAIAEGRMTGPLSSHFRCGHWRRPPGQGTNAAAEKTVHVRPTLVRADRLADNELPGGSIAHVR